MRLRFLGKETNKAGSPTLFETDWNTYLVQGWRVTDAESLAQLTPGPGQDKPA
jgi:hypothetical protein